MEITPIILTICRKISFKTNELFLASHVGVVNNVLFCLSFDMWFLRGLFVGLPKLKYEDSFQVFYNTRHMQT